MRNKSDLYKSEQIKISNKIIEILELDENEQIILYHLDHDKIKTDRIMALIPDIRKYFSFSSIAGVEYPDKFKRPWMSIIRHITKLTHSMTRKNKHLYINGDDITTQLYTFIRLR